MTFVAAGDSAEAGEATRRTGALQGEIWSRLSMIVRDHPDAASVALMNALNDAFDRTTDERLAFATPFPWQLLALLADMAVISIGASGYQLGHGPRPSRVLSYLLIGMWTATVVAIVDLGSPRLGQIRAGTQPYAWAIEGFGPAPPSSGPAPAGR